MAVAVALGRLDQALDLTLGQVLAIATHFAVATSAQMPDYGQLASAKMCPESECRAGDVTHGRRDRQVECRQQRFARWQVIIP
jgi:hypothetical protein